MASETPQLAAALAKVQGQLPHVAKGETGKVEGKTKDGRPFSYSYSYANLAGVSRAILPLLAEHGLAFIAKPTRSAADGRFVLAYSLLHESGEREDGEYLLGETDRFTQQQIGGVITYARRYCLCAVTGVAPDEDDDDAAAASQAKPRQQRKPPRNQDGSLSRSQMTEDEKDAAGVMTSAQQKEHTALRKGADKGEVPGAQRLTRTPSDDPWLGDLPPEERPGSIDPDGQMPKLQIAFGRLFERDERDQRLAAAEQIIGRQLTGPHQGRTSKNLSQVEARKLIDTLDGLSRETLIERLALAAGTAS